MIGRGDEIRWARAGLLRVCEPPAPAVWALVQEVGPVAAWAAVRARSVSKAVFAETRARTEGVDPAGWDALLAGDFRVAGAVGARLIIPEDGEWPTAAFFGFQTAARLGANGSTAPLALWIRGRVLGELPDRGVTIVGSRACTAYGQRVAADLALGLADEGVVVVSGAAFGVDAAAHRAALAAESELPTVAVLACGIDRAYPVANRVLIDAVAARGAVISEYPPGTTPARHRFLVRNRLIAALGTGTVVVEAGRRSGTLSTAAAARLMNRPVLAVPGPVTSALSVGCHLLITDFGGLLVTSTVDVVRALWPAGRSWTHIRSRESDMASASAFDDLERVGQPELPGFGVGRGASVGDPFGTPNAEFEGVGNLDADAVRVLDALPSRGSRTVAEIARESGVPSSAVFGALTVLDLTGAAEHTSQGWRRIRRGKR